MGHDRPKTPASSHDWGTAPNATWYDLKQLAFALVLFELVIAALALGTRAFFGVRTAIWVGVGIGTVVFLAFVLIAMVGVLSHAVAAFLARREQRDHKHENASHD